MLRTRVRAGPVAGLILSLVVAAVFSLVQAGDLFVSALTPALGEPAETTLRIPYRPQIVRDARSREAEGGVEAARIVVPRGTVLDGDVEAHRIVYRHELLQRPPGWVGFGGLFVIFFTLAMTLTAYLRKFGQSRLRLLRAQVGLFAVMVLLALGAKALLLFTAAQEFWIPIAAVPLWISASYDRRTAFLVAVILSLVVASLLRIDVLLLSVMLAQSMAATLFFLDRKRPRHMLLAGALSGVSSAAVLVAISATIAGAYDVSGDLSRGARSELLACAGGGVGAGILAAALRGPVQRLLGHVSRERLLYLTDLEQPLLQKMAREAPGSWEHSRAMANLAEAAASAIGADALLTRVGAYYHDLGKTAQAKYFVENLGPNEVSPHEALEPEVSADAIMAHVVVGTKLLREGGIPEPVIEFAYTHHGTQVVEYFYNKCMERGNPQGLTEDDFRYPGMKPQTKESAILMLVDSVEAASRTIDSPDRAQFEAMIQRVLFTKLKSGQLDECGLDMADLRILVNRMTDTLVNMHHHRIKYQWQVQRAEEFGVPAHVMGGHPEAPQSHRPSMPVIEVHESDRPAGLPSDPPAVEADGDARVEASPPPPPERLSTERLARRGRSEPPPGRTADRVAGEGDGAGDVPRDQQEGERRLVSVSSRPPRA